jgi:hypothetical protein
MFVMGVRQPKGGNMKVRALLALVHHRYARTGVLLFKRMVTQGSSRLLVAYPNLFLEPFVNQFGG